MDHLSAQDRLTVHVASLNLPPPTYRSHKFKSPDFGPNKVYKCRVLVATDPHTKVQTGVRRTMGEAREQAALQALGRLGGYTDGLVPSEPVLTLRTLARRQREAEDEAARLELEAQQPQDRVATPSPPTTSNPNEVVWMFSPPTTPIPTSPGAGDPTPGDAKIFTLNNGQPVNVYVASRSPHIEATLVHNGARLAPLREASVILLEVVEGGKIDIGTRHIAHELATGRLRQGAVLVHQSWCLDCTEVGHMLPSDCFKVHLPTL
ncbi:hypothetical protein Q8F55_005846 [Vanrija albida]|uniref:DRBM domain-containing protein n=1 Tax=Vanrija albida TaxID=181172 RepID=A0ABR3Q3B2_9TREE